MVYAIHFIKGHDHTDLGKHTSNGIKIKTMKIVKAHITKMPRSYFDPMPRIYVELEDGSTELLFEYYPDEISFTEKEFIGLTVEEARHLKFKKDKDYLQS